MKLDPKKTLFLIDGSSFLYRAYYGLKPLHTSTGIAVQAVFSFCRMIKKLIDTYNPHHIAIVWDSKGKTTRHEIFSEYKATRQAPPSDLFTQKEYIIEFADLIGMCQVHKIGVEADDLMYSLGLDWLKEDPQNGIIFVTLDKDMGQVLAVNPNIRLLDAFKEQFIDRIDLEEKMGFDISKLPFYFALLGDSSDNIPGVKGIGKKTAVDLVTQFNSLEHLYANLDSIKKESIKTTLLIHREDAFLSYQLFLLQYHSVDIEPNDLAFDVHNWNNARPLFEQLNFKSLLTATPQTKQERSQDLQKKLDYWKQFNFVTVQTEEQLQNLCDELRNNPAWALDTETTGLDPLEVELTGISFCASEKKAYYVPCGHKVKETQLSQETVFAALKPLLEDPAYKKYLHNAKYDQLVLHHHGIELEGIELDTLVSINLILQDWQSAGLKNLSTTYFNEEMITFEEIIKTYKYKDFSYVPLDIATLYSCADSYQTFRLVKIINDAFKQEKTIADLYKSIEHPLIQVLYEMEKKGIYMDADALQKLGEKVNADLIVIEKEIAAVMGQETINLNSPRQVEHLLFTILQLPSFKKSKTGKQSTDHEVLTILSKMHPIPALIIKHRELTKLKGTYIDALPRYINPKTNRIHTTFSQTIAATGRLASSNPNLQNIPADAGGYGIEVRAAFKADPNTILISADYSQIELRVLAYLSQDKNLIESFLHNIDIHSQTAAGLFKINHADVVAEQRQLGKRINFSIIYGTTPYGLSKDLNIPFKEAKEYIDRYFEHYPTLSEWMASIIEFAKKHGYVETAWGRRRYIPAIYEKNRTLYEEACRIAVNTVVQGTAADVMKLAMIKANQVLKEQFKNSHLLLQIHDELIISAPIEEAIAVEQNIKQILESVVSWNIPLEASLSSGLSWKDVT